MAEAARDKKKYDFLVTSGGTREKIDEARFITNSSTGRLGSLVCDALAALPDCGKIFYVCGIDAARPRTKKAAIVPVSDTASVTDAVKNILSANKVDGIVHAMAVSDYRVKSVKTADGVEVDRGRKISSGKDDLLLALEPAPKIISFFSSLAPDARLAGFKLLCGVTTETLIDAARAVLLENNCAFVIANDKTRIAETEHAALMIDKTGKIAEYRTKEEIADGIARKMDELLRGGTG
ncbi:MAG: phosphopantothenoylcysteine synthase [Spirochaetaceae bacterium]|jgi:phosphopantothenate-cysteine ligase|nr:phosphopantothenoylcysteine synthase [Spirochaetaceae bacterium]